MESASTASCMIPTTTTCPLEMLYTAQQYPENLCVEVEIWLLTFSEVDPSMRENEYVKE
jgi:hypothetical protein